MHAWREDIDPELWQHLRRYHFDEAAFAAHAAALAGGRRPTDFNALEAEVAPPASSDLPALDALTPELQASAEAEGRSAIAAGRCGAIILAGGMATRFGGRVKALVPVLGGHTFLGWKLRMLAHTASSLGVRLPVYIMTSFATDHAIRDALSAWQHPSLQLHTFTQGISLRLQRDGQLFRTQDGKLSTYAPGHGDVSWALYKSGLLADFRAQGGEHLWLSNVDNLGADLTPLLAGLHLRAGKAITVELAAKEAGDKGGAPARVDGALQIVEGFRFPPDFDQDTIPVFNTNTFGFSAALLTETHPLDYFAAQKQVDGREAIQFERLAGQLTAFAPTNYLVVPRRGADGRFFPVKDPQELEKRLPELHARLRRYLA